MDQSDIVRYVCAGVMATCLLGALAVILVAYRRERNRD